MVIAKNYLAEGAKVAICDIDPNAIQSFKKTYPNSLAVCANVTNEKEMDDFFTACDEFLDGVDVVIAGAGIGGPAALIENLKYSDWKDTIATTLDGTFLLVRWAAKHMRLSQSICCSKMGHCWINQNISNGNGQ